MIWLALLLLFVVLVPNRGRHLVAQVCLLPITPFRELAVPCRRYVDGFGGWCANLLRRAGLSEPVVVQAVGAVFLLTVTSLMVFADLDVVALGLQAEGIGADHPSLLTQGGWNAADVLSVVLVGIGVAWSVILLDGLRVTAWLPPVLTGPTVIGRVIVSLSVIVVVLTLVAAGGLAYTRFSSLTAPAEVSASMADDPMSGVSNVEASPWLLFFFVLISVLSLLTAAIGVIVLPIVVALAVCVLLSLGWLVAVLGLAIGTFGDRWVTVAYNVLLAFLDVGLGGLHGASVGLGRILNVDDLASDPAPVPAPPHEVTVPPEEPATPPLPPTATAADPAPPGGSGFDPAGFDPFAPIETAKEESHE